MMRVRTGPSRLLLLFLAILAIPGIHMGTALSTEGPERIRRILDEELAMLGLEHSPRTQALVQKAAWLGHDIAYRWSGIQGAVDGQDDALSRVLVGAWDGVSAWVLSMELIAVRVGVLLLVMPILILVGYLAGWDGWTHWYVRRTVGGRESAFIYHRAKSGLRHGTLWLVFAYLATPIPLDPSWVFPPVLIGYALLLRTAVAYFKKYV